jgi:hypothetical protein
MEQRTPFDSIVVGEGGLLIWASFMEGTAKSKLKKLTSRSTLLDDVAGRGRATHDAMVWSPPHTPHKLRLSQNADLSKVST